MVSPTNTRGSTIEATEFSIMKALAYFDLFNYPLVEEEIMQFLDSKVEQAVLQAALQRLAEEKLIFRIGQFYSLQDSWQKTIQRLAGNLRATKLLVKAKRIAKFLHKFPYVKAVAISGSLSKNYADQNADIDFFIITKENRLWISRTLLHLFKKLTFVAGRQNFFCMNYFIDERSLLIPEKNIYTAIEIKTLIPAAGASTMRSFFEANAWTTNWLPAYSVGYELERREGSHRIKSFLEKALNGKVGDKVDDLFFRWTSTRWKNKEKRGERNSKGKVMNLVTGKHFSKSDPESFHEKILNRYQNKILEFKKRAPQFFD